jgi:HD-GYP domain-containing protein (c-di-GMP phosphodiesterase class II)
MRDAGRNGHHDDHDDDDDDHLLRLVLDAAREMSRHEDPSEVMRLALSHGRRLIRFDRSIAATRRDLPAPQIRITRCDAPGTAFHDPTGKDEFPIIEGGLLADLLYAGQPRLIDDLDVADNDPSARYLQGMRSLAAIPQFRAGDPADMFFHLRREPAAFTREKFGDIVLVSTLFGQAVANLARARELRDAERSMKEQYDIIANLSNTVMSSALDLKDYSKLLERRVRERTAELHEAHVDTIYMLAVASEAKDQDTGDHLRRIYRHAKALAEELGIEDDEADQLAYAGVLHDVGKMHVPDQILKKPGPLTAEEMKTMQAHTVWGERILGGKPFFAAARRIARSHHENWDGSGYPDGARGDAIPIEARVVHLADVYDALVSPRVYKAAWTPRQAAEFIVEASGQMFDPELVRVFTHLAPRIMTPVAEAAGEP